MLPHRYRIWICYQHGSRPLKQEIHIEYVHKPARLLKVKADDGNENLGEEHAFNPGNMRFLQMKPHWQTQYKSITNSISYQPTVGKRYETSIMRIIFQELQMKKY